MEILKEKWDYEKSEDSYYDEKYANRLEDKLDRVAIELRLKVPDINPLAFVIISN